MKHKIQDEKSFLASINKTIAEERHVEYLKDVLRLYDIYKKEFDNRFSDTAAASRTKNLIHSFRVEYLLKEGVSRDVAIMGSDTFLNLAKIIILSMGWVNDHMHGFGFTNHLIADTEIEQKDIWNPERAYSPLEFYAPYWEDDPHPTYKTDELRICDFDYKKVPELFFAFDYGDGHYFRVVLTHVSKLDQYTNPDDFPLLEESHGIPPEQYPPVGE